MTIEDLINKIIKKLANNEKYNFNIENNKEERVIELIIENRKFRFFFDGKNLQPLDGNYALLERFLNLE